METNDYSRIYISKDSIIALSNEKMASYSYSCSMLWQKEYAISSINFSNEGIKQVFILDSNNLFCQDRNGDRLWEYTTREDFDNISVIEAGEMIGVSSNKAFHVIDVNASRLGRTKLEKKLLILHLLIMAETS